MIANQKHDMTKYKHEILAATSEGWMIVNEGPSGATLQSKKTMRAQTKIAFAIGLALFYFAWPIAVFLFICAFIDYVMTKPKTRFIAKPDDYSSFNQK